jgi:hypothetical protein
MALGSLPLHSVRLGDDRDLVGRASCVPDRWLLGLVTLCLHDSGLSEVRTRRKRCRSWLVGAGPARASRHAGPWPASGTNAGAVIKANKCMTTPVSSI